MFSEFWKIINYSLGDLDLCLDLCLSCESLPSSVGFLNPGRFHLCSSRFESWPDLDLDEVSAMSPGFINVFLEEFDPDSDSFGLMNCLSLPVLCLEVSLMWWSVVSGFINCLFLELSGLRSYLFPLLSFSLDLDLEYWSRSDLEFEEWSLEYLFSSLSFLFSSLAMS